MGESTVLMKNTDAPKKQATGKIIPADKPGSANGRTPRDDVAPPPRKFHPTTIFLYFLGIGTTLSGNATSWNVGLSSGLPSYVAMYFIMGLAYVTFCLCVSEVTSALPFAGGAFGLARCTLGFFPAFMIGCSETLEYVASVAFLAIATVDVVAMALPSFNNYMPLLWLLYYIPTTVVQCVGGFPFWLGVLVLGVTQLFLIYLHNFAALGLVDYAANVSADPLTSATGGISQALAVFPFFAWLFLGVEVMNLASDDVPHPKRQIPIAQTACSVTLLFSGIFTSMVCVSLPTNGGMATIISAYTPLANGFSRAFQIDSHVAPIFIMPCEYVSAYGFHWASAKLIHAMAASRLLPPWLATTSKRFGTPYVAILLTSVLGYAMCLIGFYVPSAKEYVLPVCLLFAFSSYTGQTVGYISLRTNFPIAKHRQFRNPFGITGAVYALTVWLVGIVAVLGFQGHHGIEALFFLVLILVLAVYYVLVAKKRQVMSEEETKILLVAHISRFNQIRKHRVGKKNGKQSPQVSSSNATPVSTLLGSIFTSKTTNKYKTDTAPLTNDRMDWGGGGGGGGRLHSPPPTPSSRVGNK